MNAVDMIPGANRQAQQSFSDIIIPVPNAADGLGILGPIYGLQLTGFLGPGCVALLVDEDRRGIIGNLTTVWIAETDAYRYLTRTETPVAGMGQVIGEGAFLLHPGDSVTFAEPVRHLAACSTFLYRRIPFMEPSGGSATAIPGATPRPILRVFRRPVSSLPRVGYVSVPVALGQLTTILAALPAWGTDAVASTWALPPDAGRVTIVFKDNVAGLYTPIQGAETGDFEVWWKLSTGMWVHNPADDFDAAGRGAADATHSAETYAIPAGVNGLIVIQPTTVAAFYAQALCAF